MENEWFSLTLKNVEYSSEDEQRTNLIMYDGCGRKEVILQLKSLDRIRTY